MKRCSKRPFAPVLYGSVLVALCVATVPTLGATIRVPGDVPTIKAALARADDGDVVLVAPGTYTGRYNKNLDFFGKDIELRSAAGSASTVIDCEGQGRVIRFGNAETPRARVEGFTFRNGRGLGRLEDTGGAVYCTGKASPTFVDCVFEDNATHSGGAVAILGAAPTFEQCEFIGNVARRDERGGRGGAVACSGSGHFVACLFFDNESLNGGAVDVSGTGDLWFDECVFVGNRAKKGGALSLWGRGGQSRVKECTFFRNEASNTGSVVHIESEARADLQHCLIVENAGDAPITSGRSRSREPMSGVMLESCNLFGNENGDWQGDLAELGLANDNFSADPLFCNAELSHLELRDDSPCLPGNHPLNPERDQVGALGAGCPAEPNPDVQKAR